MSQVPAFFAVALKTFGYINQTDNFVNTTNYCLYYIPASLSTSFFASEYLNCKFAPQVELTVGGDGQVSLGSPALERKESRPGLKYLTALR